MKVRDQGLDKNPYRAEDLPNDKVRNPRETNWPAKQTMGLQLGSGTGGNREDAPRGSETHRSAPFPVQQASPSLECSSNGLTPFLLDREQKQKFLGVRSRRKIVCAQPQHAPRLSGARPFRRPPRRGSGRACPRWGAGACGCRNSGFPRALGDRTDLLVWGYVKLNSRRNIVTRSKISLPMGVSGCCHPGPLQLGRHKQESESEASNNVKQIRVWEQQSQHLLGG
ncbi:uncharacterized protein LOC101788068 [Cavia porcellus]|uniref:uncharacterized protein LOC101788068 n=1 Tax=Cavia porcellus TaxID=10141 RepID=UPI002FDFB21F